MGSKVYVVVEEYKNDEDIFTSVLGVSTDLNKAKRVMGKQIKYYKTLEDVYDKKDFACAEKSETSYYVYSSTYCSYGKIKIEEKKLK